MDVCIINNVIVMISNLVEMQGKFLDPFVGGKVFRKEKLKFNKLNIYIYSNLFYL